MANPTGINQYTGKGGKVAKAARVKLLSGQLNNLSTKAPLRVKVKLTSELRSLGWGRK